MGSKEFRCARILFSGIRIMHMIHKRQWNDEGTPGGNEVTTRKWCREPRATTSYCLC
ncbi:integrase catalytic region [Caballeronia terrestris]|uniref:Integrase catalytic region n=1 Tax=Caballeronia terrestris TaxID=1226301 RepID=A0A158KKC1_9BURK|nr:integrase catalytic region [Caballeronia terrestris]